MASVTEENYLKALYGLSGIKSGVNLSALSDFLEVSKPTVNSMAKNLEKKGWVLYKKYQPLKLTDEGRKVAALIIRKHRLTEMFLVQKMGFGWEEVHEIAEQVEHIKSSRFFDRMDEILGRPTTDPHGSPIPDRNGEIFLEKYCKLSECTPNKFVELKALGQSNVDFLNYLNKMELKLGSKIFIISKESYDGSMIVNYENHQSEMLSKIVCENLLVNCI